jgi:PPOX class probable F420-dependent enzyme
MQPSPAQIREFLAHGTRTAKLATVGRGGAPHVMPVWFVLDGGQLVLTTGSESVKGRNLRRDLRMAVVVDDETPPFAFVRIRGRAALSEDPGELLRYATEIGGRYMGAGRREVRPAKCGARGLRCATCPATRAPPGSLRTARSRVVECAHAPAH